MHISLPNDIFLKALERGGLAVFEGDTDEALRETIPTQRSVKLTAKDGKFTIESSAGKANAIYFCNSDSIKIIDEGELCIDAIDLRSNLKTLQYAHSVVIKLDSDSINSKAGRSESIVPIGKVNFKAINESGREAFELSLTAYSVNDFSKTAYSDETDPSIKIQSKSLCEAIEAVSFASGPDMMTELFDNICILYKDNQLHIAATDNKRAALTTLDPSTYEGFTDGRPILVSNNLVKGIMAKMPNDSTFISVVLDPDDEHITFKTEDFKIRCSMPASSTRTKFPTFSNAINMPVGSFVVFEPKKEIMQTISRLCSSSNMGVFKINTDAEDVEIKCWNMDVKGRVGCRKIEKGLSNTIILPIQFIGDILKKIQSDAIKFSFSKDEKRVIVQSVDSPTPFYLMQRNTPTEV